MGVYKQLVTPMACLVTRIASTAQVGKATVCELAVIANGLPLTRMASNPQAHISVGFVNLTMDVYYPQVCISCGCVLAVDVY